MLISPCVIWKKEKKNVGRFIFIAEFLKKEKKNVKKKKKKNLSIYKVANN